RFQARRPAADDRPVPLGLSGGNDEELDREVPDRDAVLVDGMQYELLVDVLTRGGIGLRGDLLEIVAEPAERIVVSSLKRSHPELARDRAIRRADRVDDRAVVEARQDPEAEIRDALLDLTFERHIGGFRITILREVEPDLQRIEARAGNHDRAVGAGLVHPSLQALVVVDADQDRELNLLAIEVRLVDQQVAVRQLPLVGARELEAVEQVAADLEQIADLPTALEQRSEERLAAMRERRAEVRRRQHDDSFHRAVGDAVTVAIVMLVDPVPDHEPAGRVDDDVEVALLPSIPRDESAAIELVVQSVDDVVERQVVFSRFVVGIVDLRYRLDPGIREKRLHVDERLGAVAPTVQDDRRLRHRSPPDGRMCWTRARPGRPPGNSDVRRALPARRRLLGRPVRECLLLYTRIAASLRSFPMPDALSCM